MPRRFRNGFYLGLGVAAVIGLFLAFQWQPERQVRRHAAKLVAEIEARDWETVTALLGDEFQDQWGHDRASLIARLREISRYLRGAKIVTQDATIIIDNVNAVWSAKVTVEGEGEGVALVKERINALTTPFRLEWRRMSHKPWDWKLVRVSNAELQLPDQYY